MKKALVFVVIVMFIASAALAADVITLKAKFGDITFNHKTHSTSMDCKTCHGEGTPGKLTLAKDPAHKLCKGCHDEKKAGPTKCNECHKK